MNPWDSFHRRWDTLQSQDIGHNTADLSALRGAMLDLEKFVVYLTAKLALGQPLEPDDPVVREFLRVKKDEDPRRALLELVGQFQHRHTPRLVTCPKCGAGVRDVRGVLDERCQFCGATVRTET